jgi:hypothetical protein
MALQLGQIDKVFDPALVLPIQGREYRVEDVPALLGLYCQRVWAAGLEVAHAAKIGNDGDADRATRALEGLGKLPPPPGVDPGTPLHVAVLGDTYQQMLDDGVSGRWIQHAGMTVIAWLAAGDETAEMYWASAGRPEGMAPNRAARRRGGASTSTGGANGTRSRASTSGTTSRRTGSRAQASRSGGTTS